MVEEQLIGQFEVTNELNSKDTVARIYTNAIPAIYVIYCKSTNKKFLGLATDDCGERCRSALLDLRNKKHRNKELQVDFIRYGEADFVFDVAHRFDKKKLADMTVAARDRYIKDIYKKVKRDHHCYAPKGYNVKGVRGNPAT